MLRRHPKRQSHASVLMIPASLRRLRLPPFALLWDGFGLDDSSELEADNGDPLAAIPDDSFGLDDSSELEAAARCLSRAPGFFASVLMIPASLRRVYGQIVRRAGEGLRS